MLRQSGWVESHPKEGICHQRRPSRVESSTFGQNWCGNHSRRTIHQLSWWTASGSFPAPLGVPPTSQRAAPVIPAKTARPMPQQVRRRMWRVNPPQNCRMLASLKWLKAEQRRRLQAPSQCRARSTEPGRSRSADESQRRWCLLFHQRC